MCILQYLSVLTLIWSCHGALTQNMERVSPYIQHYSLNSTLLRMRSFARPRTWISQLLHLAAFRSSPSTFKIQNSQKGKYGSV